MIIMLVVIRCFIMVFEKMHMLASIMNTSSLHHHFPKHTTDLEKMNKTRTDDYHYSFIIIDGRSQKFKIAVLKKELLIVLYSKVYLNIHMIMNLFNIVG